MKVSNNLIGSLFWSLLHATLLVLLSYFIWNIPSDWTNSGKWLQRIHLAQALVAESDTLPNDLILINTCYDHTMVPVYDEFGFRCGQIDITDRDKLYTLFCHLKATDDYQYIVCDIDFNSELKSPVDKKLFHLISQMKRCVIPRSTKGLPLPEGLSCKSAISEYQKSLNNSNFLKYQFLTPLGESIALKMAREINNITVNKYGPFYFSTNRVCINSHILDIKTNIISEYPFGTICPSTDAKKNILQLGTDIIPMIDNGIKGVFTDKIVMIGDCFRDDIHTTVAGPTLGLMIIYNAYHALIRGYNIPPWWVWVSLFIIYAIQTLAILYHYNPHNLFQKWISPQSYLNNVIDWIGFDILFSIVGLLSFMWTETYIDAWICATYFTVFGKAHSFLSSRKNIGE